MKLLLLTVMVMSVCAGARVFQSDDPCPADFIKIGYNCVPLKSEEGSFNLSGAIEGIGRYVGTRLRQLTGYFVSSLMNQDVQ